VDSTAPGSPDHPKCLSNLGIALQARFERVGKLTDLDRAIEVGGAAVRASSLGHPDRPGYLSNLALALRTRFERIGDQADLDAAIKAAEEAVTSLPSDGVGRATVLSALDISLRDRFTRTGHLADLEAAVDASRAAVDATPAGHPDRAIYLANLGLALATQFERTGLDDDLDEAVEVDREALKATPAAHPQRAPILSNLGNALRIQFERTGAQRHLDEAVAVCRESVASTPVDHPDRVAPLSNLGLALLTRFERTGTVGDVDESIDAERAAVDLTPLGHPRRARHLSNLGGALVAQFGRTGTSADLDNAIEVGWEAVQTTPADRPDHAMMLSNLGNALRTRYEWSGTSADLDAAIEVGRAALRAIPAGHPAHAGRSTNLSNALLTRFELIGTSGDLDEAIELGRAAVDATPADHPDHAKWLTNLSVALRTRFEHAGMAMDLDASIESLRLALTEVPARQPIRTAVLNNLALALRSRFELMGTRDDLNSAIDASREAAEYAPVDHPERAVFLSNFGAALRSRFERSRAQGDLDEALDACRAAVAIDVASPRTRAGAARVWGSVAGLGGRWDEAVTAFEAAVSLLEQIAPRSLTRADQEHLLSDMGTLAADAAACCVRAGRIDRAVELFEQGRGVLLGQALDTRPDLSALAALHPVEARRFAHLCRILDRLDESSGFNEASTRQWEAADSAWSVGQTGAGIRARRRSAVTEFDQLITRIRALPGFETFLRPPTVAHLRPAAEDGPVVAVLVSSFGSYALLVTRQAVDLVALPQLTPDGVQQAVVRFLVAFDGPESAAERQLENLLAWLWDSLVSPVLEQLRMPTPPAGGVGTPRVWWCASGLLSFLPVHAAGRYQDRSSSAPANLIDRAISSYTPTLRALMHARRVKPADHDGNGEHGGTRRADIIAVSMPHTPGAADLRGAAVEAADFQRRFPDARVLTGAEATRQAVLAALPDARWAHFACHGTAEIADPSRSRLLLHDHQDRPFTVVDIARLRLDDAELAFLSACETARPGSRLTDEAIHLASAFQLAGYRHVIATLWPIGDTDAVTIAANIYSKLGSTVDAAHAVHTATRELRDRWPHRPSAWASHIHVGA
jgi:tetratricopeptide (TPR) repeat protein